MTKRPAKNPCGSCPYRQDVPSGVWEVEEYEKLPQYDNETSLQPPGVFLCHQQNGCICAGWAGTHDMNENLGLRLAQSMGFLSHDDALATLEYVSPVPLWASGQEAHDHGIADVDAPSEPAKKIVDKLVKKKDRDSRK